MAQKIGLRLACFVFALSILLPVNSLCKQLSSNCIAPGSVAALSGSPLPAPVPNPPGFVIASGNPLPAPTPPPPGFSVAAVSGNPLPAPTPPPPGVMIASGNPPPAPTPPPPVLAA